MTQPPPLPGTPVPPPPQQPIYAAPGTPPAQPKKKRSCCCSCCLVTLLLMILGVGGLMGFAWFKYRTPESPVNKEFESIPDYFPPESSFGDWTGGVS